MVLFFLQDCVNGNAALLGKFDRIAQQVQQYLLDSQLISPDQRRQVLCRFEGDLEPLFKGRALLHQHGLFDTALQREFSLFQLDLAGLDLGQVQDIIDDRQQVVGRALDQVGILLLLRVSSVSQAAVTCRSRRSSGCESHGSWRPEIRFYCGLPCRQQCAPLSTLRTVRAVQ